MITVEQIIKKEASIAVVGLGYVGLPLAVALGRELNVIGFDISEEKIQMLKNHQDPSKEMSEEELRGTTIDYTADASRIKEAGFVIVAVPTPIDSANNPDLTPLISACRTIGPNLNKGTICVFESTVYPGVTDDIAAPELEKASGLKRGTDFKLGYSPERINPGDKVHTLKTIVKIVSGEDEETLETVAQVYETVVKAGVHRAPSIQVAEAAKVIENIQRDINIALMNELSRMFARMDIDTKDVLEAAGTKWNFLKFFPGLVGGHCIGVDPYYLTHKAMELGFSAQMILSGRRINDSMGKYVARQTVQAIIRQDALVKGAKVLVLGMTFKENVSDIRNTKVIDIVRGLQNFGVDVIVSDPFASSEEVNEEFGFTLCPEGEVPKIHAVVLATPHDPYTKFSPADIKAKHENPDKAILIDVKRVLSKKEMQAEGVEYWGL